MPLYTYKCPKCDKTTDHVNSIANRKNGPECCEPMELKIMPTMVQDPLGGGANPGYDCPVTGEHVTSRKRRREIMRENNLVETG